MKKRSKFAQRLLAPMIFSTQAILFAGQFLEASEPVAKSPQADNAFDEKEINGQASLIMQMHASTDEMRRNAGKFIHSVDEILKEETYRTWSDEIKVEGPENVVTIRYEGIATEFPSDIRSKREIEKSKLTAQNENFIRG